MSSNGLTPTPIVNKNGVHTTVYRKNGSPAAQKKPLPVPSFTSARPPRHLIIDDIWTVMEEAIHSTKLRSDYKDKMTDVFRNLSAAKDDSYPAKALEMVSAIGPNIKSPVGVAVLLDALVSQDEEPIHTLHAHRTYFASNPDHLLGFAPMKEKLRNAFGTIPDENWNIPTIETHLYAKGRYKEIPHETRSLFGDSYYVAIMGTVEKYPNNVAELMEYLERGQDDPELTGFETYLAEGSMRHGVL